MMTSFDISILDGVTKIKVFEKPGLDDLKHMVDEILEKFSYGKRLWDLTEIKFDLSVEEVKHIAEYGKQQFVEPSKVAICVADDLAYGVIRQFMVYRSEEGKSAVKVFRNEAEAIKWLN